MLNRDNMGFEGMHEGNEQNFTLDLASVESTHVALMEPVIG